MKSTFLALGLSIFSVFTFAATAQAGTLEFMNGNVLAEYTWSEGPRTPDSSTMKLQFLNGITRTPAEPNGQLEISYDMPGMHHHKPRMSVVSQGNGAYEISEIYFMMAGTWEVKVALNYPDGSTEVRTFDVILDANGQCLQK